jgi:hypothetical protein
VGAPKTREVGGGQATGMANSFNDFLTQGLTTGSFGNSRTPQQLQNNANAAGVDKMIAGGGLMGKAAQKLQGKFPVTPVGPNPQEGQNQTNMFGQGINQLLQGQIGDPSSYQGLFEGLQGNNGGLPNMAGVSYNTPQFSQGQFQGAPDFQGMDLGQYMGMLGGGGGGFDAMGAYNKSLQGLGNLNIPKDFNLSQGMAANFDTPETKAIQQIIGRNMDKDVAAMRARFGSGGGTSYGTGAAFAEGNLRAEANPQIAQALSQVNRQEREMDLANRGMVGNMLLGQRAQDSQNLQAGGQIGLGQRGQDMSARMQGQGNQLGLIGMMLQQQMGQNQYGMQQADMANQWGLNNAGMQNQFNLANSGQQMNADQFNTNAQLQNQQMQNQFGLGKAGIGLGMQGNQLQAQQGMYGQLFNAMNGSNQLGTAKRETLVSPSTGSQIFNGAMGLGGMAMGLASGNPFAAMGGAQQMFGGGGGGGLGGSTPFMNGNTGLFGGQNLGMGGSMQQNSGINPMSLMAGGMTGGPNMQSAFPNMMNSSGNAQMNPALMQAMAQGTGNFRGFPPNFGY